jgi:threonine aldolase
MSVDQIKRAIRPQLYYMPRTRLICLENTHNRAGGTIYPLEEMREVSAFARKAGIRIHLDGARLWNACAATGVAPQEYAALADSVSVCLSKGLGAPVGSVLAGTKEFVEEARHYRKIFGGGMRQAGLLAAAGLYALEHHRTRLVEDHQKARYLADELSKVKGMEIDLASVQTNIVIISVEHAAKTPEEILAALRKRGVALSMGNFLGLRAVTHLDVGMDEVRRASGIIREVMEG